MIFASSDNVQVTLVC